MRLGGAAAKLGVELARDKPGMDVARKLDHLDEAAVGRGARHNQARLHKLGAALVVHLETMTMTLGDMLLAIGLGTQRTSNNVAGIGAQAHGAAHVDDAGLVGHEGNDGMLSRLAELSRVGISPAKHVTGKLGYGNLKAQADAKVRNLVRAGVTGRANLALECARAKTARDKDAVGAAQNFVGIGVAKCLAVDELDVNGAAVGNAGMVQSLDNRQVCVGKLGVLTHKLNLDLAERVAGCLGGRFGIKEGVPLGHVGRTGVQAQALADLEVKALVGKHLGHVVDGGAVAVYKDLVGVDIAERRDLVADLFVHLVVGAQDNDVRRDAQAAQLLDGVLGGLGLHLVRCGDVGEQRHVDVADVLVSHILAELADSLDERLRLDVADGTANLGDDDVGAGLVGHAVHTRLDLVGDMGNDQHRAAEEVAMALTVDEGLVHRTLRDVGVAVEALVDEALIVAQVEVALVAIVGHKDLAMLEGAHRTGVDVEVGIHLLHRDLVATALKKAAQGRCGNALTQGRYDSASHEYMFCHR